MIQIISGTHRAGARSLHVARIVHSLYQALGVESTILDLQQLPLPEGRDYDAAVQPEVLKRAFSWVDKAAGLHIVVPEYNGSMPGVLKHFIDHWSFPRAFEYRPVALIGLGGRFGGLRPVEHLQGVLLYRNVFLYPRRVFLLNVPDVLTVEGRLLKPDYLQELKKQTQGFTHFIAALQAAGLDANSQPRF